ncbi:MAG TPA: sodium/proton-translocating pyrophosphatase, partial [Candidatus Nanoarchaeia archaeon]|nr:sodium/proton-translocating pyrophosphatase [Candidatus Nanoarchaeia archaeon]
MVAVGVLAIIVSLVALAYAGYLSLRILRLPAGSEKMQEIARAIKEGAMAYMARQYKTIALFAVGITILLWAVFGTPIAVGFLFGA